MNGTKIFLEFSRRRLLGLIIPGIIAGACYLEEGGNQKGILRMRGEKKGNLKLFLCLYSSLGFNGTYPWLLTVSPYISHPPLCCTVRRLPPPISLILLLRGFSCPMAGQPCRDWDLLGGFPAAESFLSAQGAQNTFTNCSHVRVKVISHT